MKSFWQWNNENSTASCGVKHSEALSLKDTEKKNSYIGKKFAVERWRLAVTRGRLFSLKFLP